MTGSARPSPPLPFLLSLTSGPHSSGPSSSSSSSDPSYPSAMAGSHRARRATGPTRIKQIRRRSTVLSSSLASPVSRAPSRPSLLACPAGHDSALSAPSSVLKSEPLDSRTHATTTTQHLLTLSPTLQRHRQPPPSSCQADDENTTISSAVSSYPLYARPLRPPRPLARPQTCVGDPRRTGHGAAAAVSFTGARGLAWTTGTKADQSTCRGPSPQHSPHTFHNLAPALLPFHFTIF
jgi:hypothetical protein